MYKLLIPFYKVTVTVLLLSSFIIAPSHAVVINPLKKDGFYTIQIEGSVSYQECPNCEQGYEPSVPCDGTIFTQRVKSECHECAQEYTKEHKGYHECKLCIVCLPNHVVLHDCNNKFDRRCGGCESGYYPKADGLQCVECCSCQGNATLKEIHCGGEKSCRPKEGDICPVKSKEAEKTVSKLWVAKSNMLQTTGNLATMTKTKVLLLWPSSKISVLWPSSKISSADMWTKSTVTFQSSSKKLLIIASSVHQKIPRGPQSTTERRSFKIYGIVALPILCLFIFLFLKICCSKVSPCRAWRCWSDKIVRKYSRVETSDTQGYRISCGYRETSPWNDERELTYDEINTKSGVVCPIRDCSFVYNGEGDQKALHGLSFNLKEELNLESQQKLQDLARKILRTDKRVGNIRDAADLFAVLNAMAHKMHLLTLVYFTYRMDIKSLARLVHTQEHISQSSES